MRWWIHISPRISSRGLPANEFAEIAVDASADISDLVVTLYNANGTIRSILPLDGIIPTTIAGKDVYVIDTSTSSAFVGLGHDNALAFV
jgi:hypothetical protein